VKFWKLLSGETTDFATSSGGIFAADLFVIQNQGYVGAHGTSPNSHAWVVHRDKLQKAEEAIEVLREKHSKFHGDYRACDCKEFLLKRE
jgi:hypothetical protein